MQKKAIRKLQIGTFTTLLLVYRVGNTIGFLDFSLLPAIKCQFSMYLWPRGNPDGPGYLVWRHVQLVYARRASKLAGPSEIKLGNDKPGSEGF